MYAMTPRCNTKTIIESGGVSHAGIVTGGDKNDSLVDYLYLKTTSLPLDVYLACCNTDEESLVYEQNKYSLINIIKEMKKGINGFIVDENNEPINGAVVSYDNSRHHIQTQENGAFWLLVPAGTHHIYVEAPGYFNITKRVDLALLKESTTVMLKLRRDETVFGMPRILFVVMTGKRHFLFYILITLLPSVDFEFRN